MIVYSPPRRIGSAGCLRKTETIAMRFKPYPLMSLFTALSLALLMWLGAWQYGRFQQKMALQDVPPDWQTLAGDVVPGSEVVLYAYVDGDSAWHRLVAVDTGTNVYWTAIDLTYAVNPPVADQSPSAHAGLRFLARGLYLARHGRHAFSASDAPTARVYQSFDARRLASHLPPALQPRVQPQIFEPETIRLIRVGKARTGTNPLARLNPDGELPPQRHFGYALTWWGLGLALIGIYLVYHQKNGRLRFGPAPP
jgi:surfeit locus 1 family protein